MKRTAVEWFVEGLQKRGTKFIATLCGHGLDPLFDAAHRAGLRLVDVRNEQTAGYIAECYGRLTRTPGVCASSSGVAVPNAMTGLMNAWFDQAPMLYISGSANLTTLGMGCFQDCDQAGLVAPIAKYSKLVDTPQRIVHMLDQAWQAALAAPCGPVHLNLPMDVQRTPVEEEDLVRGLAFPEVAGANEQAVDEAVEALRRSRRPLIIAGSGVYYQPREARSLLTVASRFCIPVQTPIWDRGIADQHTDIFLGVAGALSSDPDLMAKADCVILAGAAVDYRVGYLRTRAKVLRLDNGWYEVPGKLSMEGVLPYTDWLSEARTLRTEFSGEIESLANRQRQAGRTHAIDLILTLKHHLPQEATLVIDGGSIGQWAHHLLTEHRYPGYWLTCGRSGVVGYGLGGAMAARLANPERPVVLLSGDGAFTFTVAELECAVRNNLPFVAIVADDQCWGITHSGHMRQFGQGLATQLGRIDFMGLAHSLGAQGVTATAPEDIAPLLQQALAANTVTLLHVPISGGNPNLA
ncbi:MAG: thiamine pyrophosphate-binding protein [Bryobacterales bacterium]|nr:thiamine pyrophosphate-binding protein [Bryobacterales bacterium]